MRKYFLLCLWAGFSFLYSETKPLNVILMIRDGGGYHQLQAANLYQTGSLNHPAYAAMPVQLALATYSASGNGYDPQQAAQDATYVNRKPTDSAAASTVLATGNMTLDGRIGVDPHGKELPNITEKAQQKGKSAGVVTTVQISHATPAGMVAHEMSRKSYAAIAQDMIEQSGLEVIMGAGHPQYNDAGKPSGDLQTEFVGGPQLWQKIQQGKARNQEGLWTFMDQKENFERLAQGKGKIPERLLGVAQVHTTLQQARPGSHETAVFQTPLNSNVPSLKTLTLAALQVLSQNPKGFFLMVEGGAIDWAGHANQSVRLIEEEIDFCQALEAVQVWILEHGGFQKNLLVVLSDHETGYLTAPGQLQTVYQTDLSVTRRGKVPALQWNSTSHTNQLVPLFAHGAGAEKLQEKATKQDSLHGPFLHHADVAEVFFSLL